MMDITGATTEAAVKALVASAASLHPRFLVFHLPCTLAADISTFLLAAAAAARGAGVLEVELGAESWPSFNWGDGGGASLSASLLLVELVSRLSFIVVARPLGGCSSAGRGSAVTSSVHVGSSIGGSSREDGQDVDSGVRIVRSSSVGLAIENTDGRKPIGNL